MTTDQHARVLVLDDDPLMLSLLGQMLARLDYKDVTSFTRGADAVNALMDALTEVVITTAMQDAQR